MADILGNNTTDDNLTLTINKLYTQQHDSPIDGTLTDLNIVVRVNPSGNARLGVYDSDGPGGLAGTLLLDAGAIALNSSGTFTISGLSLAVTSGHTYWLAIIVDTASNIFLLLDGGHGVNTMKQAAQAYGALPTPCPASEDYWTYNYQFYGNITAGGATNVVYMIFES